MSLLVMRASRIRAYASSPGKDIPPPASAFAAAGSTGDDGRAREYDLAESAVQLSVTPASTRAGC